MVAIGHSEFNGQRIRGGFRRGFGQGLRRDAAQWEASLDEHFPERRPVEDEWDRPDRRVLRAMIVAAVALAVTLVGGMVLASSSLYAPAEVVDIGES